MAKKLKASGGFYTPMKGVVIPKGMDIARNSNGGIIYEAPGKPKLVPIKTPKDKLAKSKH